MKFYRTHRHAATRRENSFARTFPYVLLCSCPHPRSRMSQPEAWITRVVRITFVTERAFTSPAFTWLCSVFTRDQSLLTSQLRQVVAQR